MLQKLMEKELYERILSKYKMAHRGQLIALKSNSAELTHLDPFPSVCFWLII